MTAAEPLAPAWRERGEPWTLGEEPLAASEFADLRYSQFTGLNIGLVGAIDYDGMSIDAARALAVQLTELVAAADAHADEVADLERLDTPAREAWRAQVAELTHERAAALQHADAEQERARVEAHERAEHAIRQRETRTGTKVRPSRAALNSGEPVIAYTVRTPREQRRHVLLVRLAAAGVITSHVAAFVTGWVL